MQNRARWAHVGLSGIMVVLCAGACDSVLDIEEPRRRGEAGAAGDAPEPGAGAPGGGGTQSLVPVEGGAGGEPSVVVITGGAGEGGAPATECEPNETRCSGEAEKSPEICDKSGRWVHNHAEAEGDCSILCNAGQCVECKDEEKQCSVCEDGDETCTQRMPQTCVDGVWEDANQPCRHYCNEGACQEPASCAAGNLASDCNGESCCLSLYVPGGEFKRNYAGPESDYPDPLHPAKISHFLLDKFEVTVGRMREFVAAYDQLELDDGDGKAEHISDDKGWLTDNPLPSDAAALKTALAACGPSSSWTELAGASEKLPITCADFNVAYAFCIWDGGRLPTDAEWNFAAAGGDEQRLYPWPAPLSGPPIDETYAVYGSSAVLPSNVGSKPEGNGRWGQADLAGNVGEMVLDSTSTLSADLCEDCVNLASSDWKFYRGGSYAGVAEVIVVPLAVDWMPRVGVADIGFRCVRDVK
jgi:sulfatase modifying factor 1